MTELLIAFLFLIFVVLLCIALDTSSIRRDCRDIEIHTKHTAALIREADCRLKTLEDCVVTNRHTHGARKYLAQGHWND